MIVVEHLFLGRIKKLVINFLGARGFLSAEGLLHILKTDFEPQIELFNVIAIQVGKDRQSLNRMKPSRQYCFYQEMKECNNL